MQKETTATNMSTLKNLSNDSYASLTKLIIKKVDFLLPVLQQGLDWYGKPKDFAVVCCVDNYENDYALIEVDNIRSITINR
jgi:hypothetical protein